MFQEFYLEQPDPLNKKVLYLTKNISPPNKKFFYPPKKKIFIIQNNNFFLYKTIFLFSSKTEISKNVAWSDLKKIIIFTQNRVPCKKCLVFTFG